MHFLTRKKILLLIMLSFFSGSIVHAKGIYRLFDKLGGITDWFLTRGKLSEKHDLFPLALVGTALNLIARGPAQPRPRRGVNRARSGGTKAGSAIVLMFHVKHEAESIGWNFASDRSVQFLRPFAGDGRRLGSAACAGRGVCVQSASPQTLRARKQPTRRKPKCTT